MNADYTCPIKGHNRHPLAIARRIENIAGQKATVYACRPAHVTGDGASSEDRYRWFVADSHPAQEVIDRGLTRSVRPRFGWKLS